MKLDVARLERQTEGVDKWVANDFIGTFNYATGTGKTFTAILAIKRILKIKPNISVTILLPLEGIVSQWYATLKEHFPDTDLSFITVYTVNEILINKIKINTDLLVVDELHLFPTEENKKTIDGKSFIKYKYNLALTATYEDPKNRHTIYQDDFPIVDEITEEEAIKRGFIASFVEFNLGVRLTMDEQLAYEKYSETIKDNITKFGKKPIELATKCLSGGKWKGKKYEGIHFCIMWAKTKGWSATLDMKEEKNRKIVEIWHPKKIMGYAVKFMTAIRKRKDLLYTCENKINATIAILEKFYGEKAIIFGEKTSYADKVGLIINKKHPNYCVVYHSQLPTQIRINPNTGKKIKFGKTRLKKEAIEAIKTGRARAIASASSIDTGLDVSDLVLAIIGSGTQNWNKQKQRSGRVKRISELLADNKTKIIVNLYVVNSQDEKWLKRRQSKSTNVKYWINSVNEITTNPVDRNEFGIDAL